MNALRTAHRRARRMLVLATFLPLLGCESGADPGTGPGIPGSDPIPPGPAAALEIASGDAQTGAPRRELTQRLVVRAVDAAGRPVPEAAVVWVAEGAGARVNPDIRATDADGLANVVFTLGDLAGPYEATASLLSRPSQTATFHSFAQVDGAMRLRLAPGVHDLFVGHPTDDVTLTVSAVDSSGLPVEGVQVRWTSDGSASLSESGSTDSNGLVSVHYVLGTLPNTEHVTASVAGLVGSPITFLVITFPGPPAALRITSGDGQTAESGTEVMPYAVRAVDAWENAIDSLRVDWTVVSGTGSVDPEFSYTAHGVDAGTVHKLGPEAGPQSVAATLLGYLDVPAVTFTTTATEPFRGVGVGTLEFYPGALIVSVGTLVRWQWTYGCGDIFGYLFCSEAHDIVFEDEPLPPTSFTPAQLDGDHPRKFEKPGTYRYRCTVHSTSFTEGQVGVVIVQ